MQIQEKSNQQLGSYSYHQVHLVGQAAYRNEEISCCFPEKAGCICRKAGQELTLYVGHAKWMWLNGAGRQSQWHQPCHTTLLGMSKTSTLWREENHCSLQSSLLSFSIDTFVQVVAEMEMLWDVWQVLFSWSAAYFRYTISLLGGCAPKDRTWTSWYSVTYNCPHAGFVCLSCLCKTELVLSEWSFQHVGGTGLNALSILGLFSPGYGPFSVIVLGFHLMQCNAYDSLLFSPAHNTCWLWFLAAGFKSAIMYWEWLL